MEPTQTKKIPLELPQPEEKLLRSPTFFEKYGWIKPTVIIMILITTLIVSTYYILKIESLNKSNNTIPSTPKISCTPRPACLDAKPRCLIPETPDMCPAPTRNQTLCTQDAKQCPDGSWVGRTGPNCEFVCPNETSNKGENLIKAWAAQNGLNIYGDPPGTMYAGGNPLFDETTGQTTSYYEYMLQKFPDKPWNK